MTKAGGLGSIGLCSISVLALVLASCSSNEREERVGRSRLALHKAVQPCSGDVCMVELPFPDRIDPQTVALYAKERLEVGPGVRVSVFEGQPMTLVNAGGPTDVRQGAFVGSIWSVGAITLGDGAGALGYVATDATINKAPSARILGETLEHAGTNLVTFRHEVMFPPRSEVVVADSPHPVTLRPGAYRKILVDPGAAVHLESGQYFTDELVMKQGSTILYNNNPGRIEIFIRDTLRYEAPFLPDRTLGRPTNVLITYFGTDAVDLQAPLVGTLIAPAAAVTLAALAESHRGGVYANTVTLEGATTKGGRTNQLPPSSGPSMEALTTSLAGPTINVTTSQTYQPDPTTPNVVAGIQQPLVTRPFKEVFQDNPKFSGEFFWGSGDKSDADPESVSPWGIHAKWQGVMAQNVAIPGVGALPMLPVPGHQEFPAQNPASWSTRSGNLVHGRFFGANTFALVNIGGFQPAIPPGMLTVQLSASTLVVPVIAVTWRQQDFQPDFSDRSRAWIDFIKFFDTVTDASDPNVLFNLTDPGASFMALATMKPPDTIWEQCGIQFQIVRSFSFVLDDGWFENIRKCSPDPGVHEFYSPAGTPTDFDVDGVLKQKIIEQVGQEAADLLFITGLEFIHSGVRTLRPIVAQFGPLNCPIAAGKTDPDVPMVLIDTDHVSNFPCVIAHEFGHALSLDHNVPDDNLMNQVCVNQTTLTPDQCERARKVAKKLTDSYIDYNVATGRIPASTKVVLLQALPSEVESMCCQLADGTFKHEPSSLCALDSIYLTASATPVLDSKCQVCCKLSDPVFLDPPGSPYQIQVTFNDQCSTERQLTMDQCDQVCCRSFSGLREVTRYECTAHRPDQIGGSVIRPAPCPSCIVDSDCAGTPSTPFCFSGFCKQCREDADCGGVRCDPSTHTCVVPQ